MSKFISKFWPYFLIVFLVAIFFYKVFLGLIPIPADLIVGGYFPWYDYKWGSVAGVPIKNSLLTDAVSLVYPLRFYASELIKSGQFPLWNSRIFGGYPLVASFPTQIFFPTFVFWLIFSSPVAWTLQIIFQIVISMFGMYLLTRSLNLKKIASLFAAVTYSFGGFGMVRMEWNVISTASVILPFVIYFLNKFLYSKDLKLGVGLSISFGLMFLAGYPPVVIFSILPIMIWVAFAWPGWKTLFKTGIFLILGVALSAIQLLPGLELFLLSQRKFEVIPMKEVFVQMEYLVSFLAPNFFGNPTTGNFWGPVNYLQICFYSGIVALMVGILGITLVKKEKTVRIALFLFFTTCLVAFDNPISRFIYNLGVWGGSSMTMDKATFLGNFSIAILGAFGLSQLSKVKISKIILFVLPVNLITTGFFIATFFLKSGNPNLSISFRNLIISTVLSWLVFSILVIKLKSLTKEILLLTVLTAELFYFGWKFNTFADPKYLYPETPVIKFLEQNKQSRFASEMIALPPDMFVPHDLSSINGSDSYYPEGVAKLIAVANSGKIDATPQTKGGGLSNFSSVILERMSTKYFVTVKRDAKWGINADGKFLDPAFYDPKFTKVFEDKSVVVFENKNALPMAFFVDKIIKTSDDDILSKLNDKNFPARTTALSGEIEGDFESGASAGKAQYLEISNSRFQIKTKNSKDSFLVVLNPFYPGWEAYIDGNKSQIHKVNYAFEGVFVSKGEHTIDLYYKPKSLEWGAIISVVALGILLAILSFKNSLSKFLASPRNLSRKSQL